MRIFENVFVDPNGKVWETSKHPLGTPKKWLAADSIKDYKKARILKNYEFIVNLSNDRWCSKMLRLQYTRKAGILLGEYYS